MVDRYSKTPLFAQVAERLRERIQAGEWAPGAAMPSERQVAEEYDVARPTARRALAVLEEEGLLLVLPQRGVVRSPKS
ncbi:GntR family transcriptional regulator [Glycomyces sp. NPDC046736]|uniref:GntR family transcriptional regulator n=1 Tax=Glycomyces sp. NPDC046736 TaxID=3155615 RepID=UPI0033DFD23E